MRGCREHGFNPIIASGVNATTLHYDTNNSVMGRDDLVLMDIGAEYSLYSGDVTRTLPVSGVYAGRARDIYQAVLQVQKKVIDHIKPGTNLVELNKLTNTWTAEALVALGLIEKGSDLSAVRKYYMHGVSHYLGLDAHDPGSPFEPLTAGVVLTVEPGIYVRDENIGVRIEDDVLVTETGCEVLSMGFPKEIDEIEELLKSNRC
jgi:Xaa-Pro aminopeptidase